MAQYKGPQVDRKTTHEQLLELFAMLVKDIQFILNGHLDANNIKANSIETKNLKADSVTADKISVNELSAISANLGTIIAGLIRGIEIYGSYIATAEGTFPRSEMSSSDNMFAVLYEPDSWIKMQATGGTLPRMLYHYYGSEASMFFFNNLISHVFYIQSNSDMEIRSTDDINITPGPTKHIKIPDWTKLQGGTQTLHDVLDAIDSRFSGIDSSISALWSAIGSLDSRVTALGG